MTPAVVVETTTTGYRAVCEHCGPVGNEYGTPHHAAQHGAKRHARTHEPEHMPPAWRLAARTVALRLSHTLALQTGRMWLASPADDGRTARQVVEDMVKHLMEAPEPEFNGVVMHDEGGGMSDIDRGPLHRYEVTWANGHVEYVEAHQVITPPLVTFHDGMTGPPRWTFHGEIDGRWRLLLSADAAAISIVRDVTLTERAEP